jgi:hypothetical protein
MSEPDTEHAAGPVTPQPPVVSNYGFRNEQNRQALRAGKQLADLPLIPKLEQLSLKHICQRKIIEGSGKAIWCWCLDSSSLLGLKSWKKQNE